MCFIVLYSYWTNVSDLKNYLESNNYPLNPEKYLVDGILIRFDC